MSYDISLYDIIAMLLSGVSVAISLVIYCKSLARFKIYVSKAVYVCTQRHNPIHGSYSKYWGYVEATLINKSSNPISIYRISLENIDYKSSDKFQTIAAGSENIKEKPGVVRLCVNPEGIAIKLPIYIEPYSSVKTSFVFEDISLIVNDNDSQSQTDNSEEAERVFKSKVKTYKLFYPNDGKLNLILYTSRKKIKSSISFKCIK